MVSSLVVGIPSDRHEVEELSSVPVMKDFWRCTYEVPGDEDVEDASDERGLFPRSDGFGVAPSLIQSVDVVSHLSAIPVQLLVWAWHSTPPLFYQLVTSIHPARFELLLLLAHSLLHALEMLR